MLPAIFKIRVSVDTLSRLKFRVSNRYPEFFRVFTDTLKVGFKNSTDTLKWYIEYHDMYHLCNLRHISYILNLKAFQFALEPFQAYQ